MNLLQKFIYNENATVESVKYNFTEEDVGHPFNLVSPMFAIGSIDGSWKL